MRRREIAASSTRSSTSPASSEFLDTPVKRYSSGMYVRLAFAVAAHLEPEILLVDEVLAVGDAEFQRRCLGRMEDLSQSGRTVVFVSHQMQAVAQLCDRAIWLDGGGSNAKAPPRTWSPSTCRPASDRLSQGVGGPDTAPGNDLVRSARCASSRATRSRGSRRSRAVGIEIGFRVLRRGEPVFRRSRSSTRAVTSRSTPWIPARAGSNLRARRIRDDRVDTCELPQRGAHDSGRLDRDHLRPSWEHAAGRSAVAFHVQDPAEGDSARGLFTGQWQGVVRPLLDGRPRRASKRSLGGRGRAVVRRRCRRHLARLASDDEDQRCRRREHVGERAGPERRRDAEEERDHDAEHRRAHRRGAVDPPEERRRRAGRAAARMPMANGMPMTKLSGASSDGGGDAHRGGRAVHGLEHARRERCRTRRSPPRAEQHAQRAAPIGRGRTRSVEHAADAAETSSENSTTVSA